MREFWSKRVLPLLIAGVLTCSLAGCGNAESASVTSDVSSDIPQTSGQASEMPETTSVPEESENAESDGNNILIAYFTAAENSGVDAIASASYTVVGGQAVGRIRAVADMIQKNVGGDLFSIQTSVVYPADGAELIDYAAQEQEENARPELTTHIENLDQYDTIFIGYPNWWADLPMAVYSFFDEYDFSGKTIIPFNVHKAAGSPARSRPLKNWNRMPLLLKMDLPLVNRRWLKLTRM